MSTTMPRFYAAKTGTLESDGWSVADSQLGMFLAQALDRDDAEAICASLNEGEHTCPYLSSPSCPGSG